jgi:hypothetical protein
MTSYQDWVLIDRTLIAVIMVVWATHSISLLWFPGPWLPYTGTLLFALVLGSVVVAWRRHKASL